MVDRPYGRPSSAVSRTRSRSEGPPDSTSNDRMRPANQASGSSTLEPSGSPNMSEFYGQTGVSAEAHGCSRFVQEHRWTSTQPRTVDRTTHPYVEERTWSLRSPS